MSRGGRHLRAASRWARALAVVAVVAATFVHPSAAGGPAKLYWTEGGSGHPDAVWSAEGDGSSPTQILRFIGGNDLELDLIHGKLYLGSFRVFRASLFGTSPEVFPDGALFGATGVAVDPGAAKIYWAQSSVIGPQPIRRANVDGTGFEDLISGAGVSGHDVELDTIHGKIYWTDPSGRRIGRANLDGSGVETVIGTGLSAPKALAIDPTGGRIYWGDAGRLMRANTDGSGVEVLVTLAGGSEVGGVAIDAAAGKVYWTDPVGGTIQRASLDGAAIETLFWGRVRPRGIAVVGDAVVGDNSDRTPPAIAVPADMVVEATRPGGAVVTYAATATDGGDGAVSVTCAPASGSVFALGTTVVGCSATDAAGNRAEQTFRVTVVDTRAPSLTLPGGVTVDATTSAGAIATYVVSAVDVVDSTPAVVCSPPAGSTFAIGATQVVCTAADASGNASRGSFDVHVRGAGEQLLALLALVDDGGFGPGASLREKLVRVLQFYDAGNYPRALDTLRSFVNEVRAQAGKSLTAGKAAELEAAAARIAGVIG
jgi:HYR domain/Low-density lipoprotein receptor repeat class B